MQNKLGGMGGLMKESVHDDIYSKKKKKKSPFGKKKSLFAMKEK